MKGFIYAYEDCFTQMQKKKKKVRNKTNNEIE